MNQPSISVVVFAVPDRESHGPCFASLRASDIGDSYVVRRHPPGISADHHWLETHLFAAAMPTEYVLVLEDDVLVNRHILHNIDTWRWKHHKEFRAGFLFASGGAQADEWYAGKPMWSCTQAVLYRTKDLPRLVARAWSKMQFDNIPWDLAITWSANTSGRIRVHAPCLAEHLDHLPSIVGNDPSRSMRTSRGTYDEKWKRPERHQHGVIDEFGRKVV